MPPLLLLVHYARELLVHLRARIDIAFVTATLRITWPSYVIWRSTFSNKNNLQRLASKQSVSNVLLMNPTSSKFYKLVLHNETFST